MKKTFSLFLLLSVLSLINLTAFAQQLIRPPAPLQEGSSSLNSVLALPEADTLIYVNTERILNDAIPKFMPPKDVADIRKAFEDVKTSAGIDPSKVEYLVIATRSRKPTADLNFVLPEYIAMIVGDFNADALVSLAHVAANGKLRDEKYGSKTIGLMTIDPIAEQAEKNPLLKPLSDIGIVAVSPNTLLIGSPPYLRAAIDSSTSTKRIDPERLRSLLRDPEALISVAGSPRMAFNKAFGILGTEASDRPAKCDSRLGDFYLSLDMDEANLMLKGIMNADNPDTAKIISKLINAFIAEASAMIDKNTQATLNAVKIDSEGDDVVLNAKVPQQMVIDLIKEKMAPKKQEETTVTTPKQPMKKRSVNRRRRRTTKP